MRLSSPTMARGSRRGYRGRRRRRRRHRARRHRDPLLRGRRPGLDGGICVTASHNPKEYTGMKIVRRGALPVGGDSGLAEIRGARRRPISSRSVAAGQCTTEDVWPGFVAKALSFVDVAAIKPLRVVDRRSERDGRRDAPSGSRPPSPARGRALPLRARTEASRITSPTRSSPRTASSSSRS